MKSPLELGENDWPGQICVTPEGDVAVIISRTSYELDENGEPINYSSSLELRVISSKDGSVKILRILRGFLGKRILISSILAWMERGITTCMAGIRLFS